MLEVAPDSAGSRPEQPRGVLPGRLLLLLPLVPLPQPPLPRLPPPSGTTRSEMHRLQRAESGLRRARWRPQSTGLPPGPCCGLLLRAAVERAQTRYQVHAVNPHHLTVAEELCQQPQRLPISRIIERWHQH